MEKELGEVWRCAVCAEGACPDAACVAFGWCARVSAKGACPGASSSSSSAPLGDSLCYCPVVSNPGAAPIRFHQYELASLETRTAAAQWKKNWVRCVVVAAC
jgi:hypothetical protein